MNLSPTVANNNLYLEIKKNSDLIHDDIFAIYLGVHESEHRLQFGGYEEDMARFTDGVRFATVKAVDDKNRWVLPAQKMMFSKEKDNKWEEFTLSGAGGNLVLKLDTNKMTII